MRALVYSPVRLFGEGIGAFLQSIDQIDAVLAVHEPGDLGARTAEFGPDVALFDVTTRDVLPAARGLRARCPEITAVALAVPEVAEDVIACADAGFVAYIPRNASAAEMIAIVDLAVQGETVCDRRITRALFAELARRRPPRTPPQPDEYLTSREIETARLLIRGLSNKEIARELHLSIATIKNHVHSVLRKLQVGSRAEVGQLVVESPWVLGLPHDDRSGRRVGA